MCLIFGEDPISRGYIFPFLPLRTLCASLDHSRASIEPRRSQWECCKWPQVDSVSRQKGPMSLGGIRKVAQNYENCQKLCNVSQCYRRFCKDTQCYARLRKVSQGFARLRKVAKSFARLRKVAKGCKKYFVTLGNLALPSVSPQVTWGLGEYCKVARRSIFHVHYVLINKV